MKSKIDAPPPKRRKVSLPPSSDEDEEEHLKANVKRKDAIPFVCFVYVGFRYIHLTPFKLHRIAYNESMNYWPDFVEKDGMMYK